MEYKVVYKVDSVYGTTHYENISDALKESEGAALTSVHCIYVNGLYFALGTEKESLHVN